MNKSAELAYDKAMNRLTQSLNALRQKSAAASIPSPSMLSQYLLFGALAIALPIVIVFSVELWMVTMYTSVVGIGRFHEQYFSGVYRYRILGRDQFLFLYQFLHAHFKDRPYPLPRDPSTSLLSYAAFAISNGFYFALSNLILLSFMWVKRRGFLDRDLVSYLYYTLLLSLSMAVVTPYDQLAYLLLLIGILGARQRSIAVGLVLIAISAIAGTLNRETEFLLASFLATMAIVSPALLAKRYWIYLAADIVLSIVVYVGLRLLLPGKVALIQYVTLGGIWAPESVAVLIVIFAGAIVFAMKLHHNVRPAFVLLAMSSPYLVTVFLGGIFRELRISIPILLCLFCVYLFLSRAADVLVDEGARVAVG
jgi:hypothetical protein